MFSRIGAGVSKTLEFAHALSGVLDIDHKYLDKYEQDDGPIAGTAKQGVFIVKWQWKKDGVPTFHHAILVTDEDDNGVYGPLSGTQYDWGSDNSTSANWDLEANVKEPRRVDVTAEKRSEEGKWGRKRYVYVGHTYWTSARICDAINMCGPSWTYNVMYNNCRALSSVIAELLTENPLGLDKFELRVRCADYREACNLPWHVR